MARDIIIDFMPPGMLEFGVVETNEAIEGTGYSPLGPCDLQVDRDAKSGEPLAYIAYNFHQTFFDILRTLDQLDLSDTYNLPEANLYNLSLRQVLTWIYTHYVLENKEALKLAA